jgi:hypothetical protein
MIVVPGVAFLCCGNDSSNNGAPPGATTTPPATTTPTSQPTGTNNPPDAGPDARRTSCLDRPDSLPRPSDRLPCELIPPGLTL